MAAKETYWKKAEVVSKSQAPLPWHCSQRKLFHWKDKQSKQARVFPVQQHFCRGTLLGSSTFHPGNSLRSGQSFPGAWRFAPALLTKKQSHSSYGVQYFRKLSPAEKEIREENGSMDHQKYILWIPSHRHGAERFWSLVLQLLQW